MDWLYKIHPLDLWQCAEQEGRVPWSAVDRRDGFVHLSAAHQVVATAGRHFGDDPHLVLIALDPARLARWEASHAGEPFPHVYGDVPLAAVVAVHELVGEEAGRFDWPDELS